MIATKRMFASSIVESDRFLDLPGTSQLLYFHLSMRADNDGVVDSARQIMRAIRASDGDMKALVESDFVIILPNERLIVITDWHICNRMRFDSAHNGHGAYYNVVRNLSLDSNNRYVINCTTNNMITPTGDLLETSHREQQSREEQRREQQQHMGEQTFDSAAADINNLLEVTRVRKSDYDGLCRQFGRERVDEQLRGMAARPTAIKNPGAWLRRATENNYQSPQEKPPSGPDNAQQRYHIRNKKG